MTTSNTIHPFSRRTSVSSIPNSQIMDNQKIEGPNNPNNPNNFHMQHGGQVNANANHAEVDRYQGIQQQSHFVQTFNRNIPPAFPNALSMQPQGFYPSLPPAQNQPFSTNQFQQPQDAYNQQAFLNQPNHPPFRPNQAHPATSPQKNLIHSPKNGSPKPNTYANPSAFKTFNNVPVNQSPLNTNTNPSVPQPNFNQIPQQMPPSIPQPPQNIPTQGQAFGSNAQFANTLSPAKPFQATSHQFSDPDMESLMAVEQILESTVQKNTNLQDKTLVPKVNKPPAVQQSNSNSIPNQQQPSSVVRSTLPVVQDNVQNNQAAVTVRTNLPQIQYQELQSPINPLQGEMERVELEKLREQAADDSLKKDGEIGILKSRLEQSKEDNIKLKMEILHKQQSQEKAKKEVDKIKDQLAFKEHEIQLVTNDGKNAPNQITKITKPNITKAIKLSSNSTLLSSPVKLVPQSGKKRSTKDELEEEIPVKKQKQTSSTDSTLEKENETLKKNVVILKERLKGVKRALNGEFEKPLDTINLRDEIGELFKTEIRELKKQIESRPTSSPGDSKKLTEQFRDVKKQLEAEKATVVSLEQQLADRKKKDVEMQALKQENEQQRQHILGLFEKNTTMQTQVDNLLQLKEDNTKFAVELEKHRKLKEQREQQLSELTKKNETLERKVVELKDELEKVKKESNTAGDSALKEEISDLKKKNDLLNTTIKELVQEKEAIEEKSSALEQNLVELWKKNKALEQKYGISESQSQQQTSSSQPTGENPTPVNFQSTFDPIRMEGDEDMRDDEKEERSQVVPSETSTASQSISQVENQPSLKRHRSFPSSKSKKEGADSIPSTV